MFKKIKERPCYMENEGCKKGPDQDFREEMLNV
jgi:hypothetical protein